MKTPTLLVVDGEQLFRQLLVELLGREGLSVQTCDGGAGALRLLEGGGIDLVMSDLTPPGLAEGEIVRFCRQLDPPPEVLLMVAQADQEQAIAALRDGAAGYLIKPFHPEELRHRVLGLLEKRRLAEDNARLCGQNDLLRAGLDLFAQHELDPLLEKALPLAMGELGVTMGFAFVHRDGDFGLPALVGMDRSQAQSWAPLLFSGLSCGQGPWWLSGEESQALHCDKPILVYPLSFQEQIQGGLVLVGAALSNRAPGLLCAQAALAFENASRLRDARELMYCDDLTGLFNHRYLHLILEQELRRSCRYRLEFALIFIDLDYFKNINDRHGHLVGSAVLAEVGQVLRQCLRDTDLLFRYGGDEFTALLVETEEQGALVVAERMRATLEKHRFLAEQGVNARLTATLGVATFPHDAEDHAELLMLADRAMYWGKKKRNVVCPARDLKDF
ncbi:GGDEF domain-containing protein [Geoalkalibacter sp.]|uniref:GGDEF domain-containing protein n=1 Tax=Geoalkalibacter sp. TaxID=3041440 RepID=UPI00272E6323|nr:diguanylate cyclase [Geoalkalibacter sp.]